MTHANSQPQTKPNADLSVMPPKEYSDLDIKFLKKEKKREKIIKNK